MLTVVLDTNVLISAIGWSGAPRRCLELAERGQVRAVTCEPLMEELARILRRKLAFSEQQIAETHAYLLNCLDIVPVAGTLHGACPDPKDDVVLECALTASANLVVSGDRKHLLALGNYEGIPIIAPIELLARVVEQK